MSGFYTNPGSTKLDNEITLDATNNSTYEECVPSYLKICLLGEEYRSIDKPSFISGRSMKNQRISKNVRQKRKLDLESIMSSLRLDFEKEGIAFRID